MKKPSPSRSDFESLAQLLVGEIPTKVVYYEVDYQDGRYSFLDDPRFDSLDFGLELTFSSGNTYGIWWGSEFEQYGISLRNGPQDNMPSARFLDVSITDRWEGALGRKITAATVFWSWVEELGKPETRVAYPQDLLIQFEGGGIIIVSALEIRDGDQFYGMVDHLTVFSDPRIASKFMCCSGE